MAFGWKEKVLEKKLKELFYQGEELKAALGTLSDVYGCMASVVYERDGKNRVLCSTELNIDRLDALNHQLARIRITKEEVLSYDGFYKNFKTYPLVTSELEGALLLDGEKIIPPISDEVLRILSMYVRHEKMRRDLSASHLTDAVTGLKNREGLISALVEERTSFEFLACIRLLNRAEMLNKLGCHYDVVLSVKCSNEILRRLKRQVYRLGIDTWAVLFVKGLSEDTLMDHFHDLADDLSESIEGTAFSIAYTKIENDPLYSLFLCESSVMKADASGVTFMRSYSEGELSDYMHTRNVVTVEESQIKKVGADFFQESEVYNLNRANTTVFEEEVPEEVTEENYTELDEFGDPAQEEGDTFDFGEAFEDRVFEDKEEEDIPAAEESEEESGEDGNGEE